MEWYIPITILPGIGLLILSTSNILIALNQEIVELEVRESKLNKEKFRSIVKKKLAQLKNLNYALIGQYLSAFALVVGGILGVMVKDITVINSFVIIGVGFLSVSIGLLIQYSFKSLQIRQEHLKL